AIAGAQDGQRLEPLLGFAVRHRLDPPFGLGREPLEERGQSAGVAVGERWDQLRHRRLRVEIDGDRAPAGLAARNLEPNQRHPGDYRQAQNARNPDSSSPSPWHGCLPAKTEILRIHSGRHLSGNRISGKSTWFVPPVNTIKSPRTPRSPSTARIAAIG